MNISDGKIASATAQLLNKTRAILQENTSRDALKADSEFNIFTLIRPKENAISRVLANLFSPLGSHRQGHKYLDDFLTVLRSRLPANIQTLEWMDGSSWKSVKCEEATPSGRRLDVVLRFSGGIIGIENKPWGADQHAQLTDYSAYLRAQNQENWLLLYLSNWEPSETSIAAAVAEEWRRQGKLVRLSFFGLASWIEQCASANCSHSVQTSLRDFGKYVRTSINYEIMSFEPQSKIAALITEPDAFETALAVFNAVLHVKRGRFAHLRDNLTRAAEIRGWTLKWCMDPLSKDNYFSFTSARLPGKTIQFEWATSELKQFSWGLNGVGVETQREHQLLTEALGPGKIDPNWPWWQEGAETFNLADRTDPTSEAKVWQLVESGAFANDVIKRAEMAFQALS